MRYRLQRHDGTDCSATMVPITVLRMVPIQRYRQRLSRTSKFLIDLVDRLSQIGVNIKSLKEQWFDTTTPHGRLIFTVFAGLSQFERDLAQLRTREGLEAARARGRKGGRPKKDSKTIELALKLYDSQTCTIAEITRTTGVSKATLYQYINNRKK